MTHPTPRIGRLFGRLTVKKFEHGGNNKDKFYLCVCLCGKECVVRWAALRSGDKKSCGCLAVERAATFKYTNGERQHELFQTWKTMVKRCYSHNNAKYKSYGAKGIGVCDAWREDFNQFVADIGPRPSLEYSLDRIDNAGWYEPNNVRWATSIEQQTNRPQKSPYLVTIGGKTKTLYSLCKASGVDRNVVVRDIRSGITPEIAFVAALLRKQLFASSGSRSRDEYEMCYEKAKLQLIEQP
jgi:hypothetical protein